MHFKTALPPPPPHTHTHTHTNEHKQEKILYKHKQEGLNKIYKKQPCSTSNSKMTIDFLTCSKSVK